MFKRLIFVVLVCLCVLICFLFFYPGIVLCSKEHSAENGVLDLSKESMNSICALTGEWRFKPLEYSGKVKSETFIEVPSDWFEKTGKRYTSGVYSLEILLPDNIDKEISITIPNLYEIINVKINKEDVFSAGDWDTNRLDYTRKSITIMAREKIELDIAVKNIMFRNGGLYLPPIICTTELKNKNDFIGIFRETIAIGILFYIVFTHSLLFFTGFPNRNIFFMVLAALFYALRGLLTGNLNILQFYPDIPLVLAYRLEYLFSFMGLASIVIFSASLIKTDDSIKIKGCKILFMAGVIFAAASLLVSLKILSFSIYILDAFSVLCLLFLIIIHLSGVIKKQKYSIIMFIGSSIFFLLVVLDIVYIDGIYTQFTNTSQLGILIFLIAQSIALAKTVSNAFLKAEKIARKLEKDVKKRTVELKKANDELKRLSTTDFLTGCNNRRSFFEITERQIAISSRHNRPISILLIDIDDFKKINDKFGHGVGDTALKFITQCCENELRKSDVLARLGGDEFVILLPETNIDDAFTISERIRKKITEMTPKKDAGLPNLSISGGLITLIKGETIFKALERADYLLYQAKKNGRNQIQRKNYYLNR